MIHYLQTTVEDTVDEEVDQLTTADEEEEMGEEADAELVPVERVSSRIERIVIIKERCEI